MTIASILTDAQTVLTEFGTYLAIAVAIPLGLSLVPRIKRWVTR